LILVGLYLAKYDSPGLKRLGLETFVEAFNVIGYALRSKPASIKNYRDEFDPLFPNRRKGWHKRRTRDYCLAVFEECKELDFESFTSLAMSFFAYGDEIGTDVEKEPPDQLGSTFAQRLITGLAAEHYFASRYAELPEFRNYVLENTTRFRCGYDFRLRLEPNHRDFLAIEVKGLKDPTASLSMTPREYEAATALRERFFLFVVRNFRESPFHEIFRNPLSGLLHFKRTERVTVQVSWIAKV
jgi:hypothetical protein